MIDDRLLTNSNMDGFQNMPMGRSQIKACCLKEFKEVRKMDSVTKQIAWCWEELERNYNCRKQLLELPAMAASSIVSMVLQAYTQGHTYIDTH